MLIKLSLICLATMGVLAFAEKAPMNENRPAEKNIEAADLKCDSSAALEDKSEERPLAQADCDEDDGAALERRFPAQLRFRY